jgi:Skp family chaperone for outer membrane proteins
MFCTQCGRQNPEGNRFCAGCGATLRSIPKPAQRSSKALWIAGGSSFLVLAIALLVWLTGTPSEQVIIDVSGGTQQFPKSGVQLEIPPGATQKSVSAKLNVVSTPPTPPEGASLLGSAYDIRSEVAAFDEPVRLSIPVPSDKWPIAPGELVTVATWNEELRDWVPLGSELDEQQKTVSTWVTHFSTYAVINWNPQKPNAVATRTTQHFHVVGLSKPFSEDPEQFTKYVQRLTPLVERVAELLEEAWSLVIDQLGYREPRLRARDKRIWVWITPLVKRDWAGFVDEPPKTLARSLPDMNIYLSPQLDKETPLHEFFHIVQIQSYLNRYRYEPAAEWWMEATSAWVQTKVQDASKIYRKYYSLTKTELLKHSLDDSGEIDDAREYLAGVFASYLESLFGTEVIRRTWEIISAQVQAGQTANPLKAIESALSERGASLSDIYFNFALDYAYFRTSPWLGFLPAFKTEEVEASASQQTKTFSLPYMTCQFNRLTARRDTGTLKVAANADASIRYAIIDEPSKNVVHPSAGAAIQVAGFGATTKSAVLIACNTSLRGKGEFQLNYTVAREVVQPSREGISIGYVNEQAIGGISIDQLRARLKGMSGEKPDLVLKRQNVVLFANHTKVVDLTQAVRSQANIVVPMSPLRKIAYINAERVFQDYRKTSEFVQTFRVEAERMQQELKALQDRFKRGLISENTFQQEAARLQQELQRLDHQLTSEIQGDMIKAIEQIAQEGGIDWVTQRKDVVLFANPEVVIDLTDLVTRKLNGEQIESGLAALPPVELLKKVGYVRTSVVLSQYEETEVIQQLRADLEKKRQELRDMFKVLQDRFRRGLLSEDEFQRQGTRIQQELQRLDLEFTGRVQDDTHQAIAELAKRENYDLTLNDEVVLFVNETKIIDLTEQVLSYLRAKSKINTPTRSQGYPPQVISVDVPSQIPPETPISISVSFADPDGDVNTVEILDCSLTFLLLEQEPKCPRVMDNSPLQSANVKGVTSGVIKITLKCMLFPYGAKRKQKIILYDDKGLSSAPFEFTFECAKEQTPKGTNSTTLTVCPSGCAFSRIQDAINVATPGATIEIGPGTYYENVEIAKSLTLLSQSEGQTQIIGTEAGRPVVLIPGDTNIEVRIENLIIAGAKLSAPTDTCTAQRQKSFCSAGILVSGRARVILENSEISRNDTDGVWAMDSVNVLINNTKIFDNAKQCLAAYETEKIECFGIDVSDAAQVTILNSTVLANAMTGFMVRNSAQAKIQSSTVSRNGRFGLVVQNVAEIWLEDSVISQNGWGGVGVGNAAKVELRRGIIEGNGVDANCDQRWLCNGVDVADEAQVRITESTIRNNNDWGVATRLDKCDYKEEGFHGQVILQGNNVIAGNGRGQLCLPEGQAGIQPP